MLRVIGAGLPRTGTHTLKVVLGQLLGGECYHMTTVFDHPEHVPAWQGALDGSPPDWQEFLGRHVAAVDWPASAFWAELADCFPDALILLSTRTDGAAWSRSVNATIREGFPTGDDVNEWQRMFIGLWHRTLGPSWLDDDRNIASYDQWVDSVRRAAPPGRLLEWRATEGWAPICDALGLAIPDQPFPLTNSTREWEERRRQRQEAGGSAATETGGDE